ncbi:DUF1320 domain-containing protein [Hydrogenovibrio sp. 3SP14C1]|uniref:gp436 family protein n=1 Tax=Hydrogenovibrio sp. 3SP14C1 TaxID=3038774 RepID=UPI0024167FB0|nr:DUF1320 domain-containing protein [Hydrogenovibrio sp. 3SP14C1]MDG4811661.1 DUF1320 domain-containing protein [Hydrogenovibrio sp. 3SP14C1]
MSQVYATQADMELRIGVEPLLVVADRDDDGVVDAEVVTAALEAAQAEIDAYIGSRFSLPVATVPKVVTDLCIDIALYKLSVDADASTDERRLRYEDTVNLLRRFSKGEVTLGLSSPPKTTNGQARLISQPRRFRR